MAAALSASERGWWVPVPRQDAINAALPQTQLQTCIVHLLRHALSFASWKDRRQIPFLPVFSAMQHRRFDWPQ